MIQTIKGVEIMREKAVLSPVHKLAIASSTYDCPGLGFREFESIVAAVDWPSFHELFFKSCWPEMSGLLLHSFERMGLLGALPIELRRLAGTTVSLQAARRHRLLQEAHAIAVCLEGERIRPVFLKGVALIQTVYRGNPRTRPFEDIDVLVAPEEVDRAYALLMSRLGYGYNYGRGLAELVTRYYQHMGELSRDGLDVDLHHRLTLAYEPYKIDTARIVRDAQRVASAGGSLYIPCAEDMLIQLCIHMYQHYMFDNKYRLKHAADIANTIFSPGAAVDWNRFLERVKADGIEFPVAYSLYHTNVIYASVLETEVVPGFVIEELKTADFDREKDAVRHKGLLTNLTFGYWDVPILERLFMPRQEVVWRTAEFYMDHALKNAFLTAMDDLEPGQSDSHREWYERAVLAQKPWKGV